MMMENSPRAAGVVLPAAAVPAVSMFDRRPANQAVAIFVQIPDGHRQASGRQQGADQVAGVDLEREEDEEHGREEVAERTDEGGHPRLDRT